MTLVRDLRYNLLTAQDIVFRDDSKICDVDE